MLRAAAVPLTALALGALTALPAPATPPGTNGRIVFERPQRGNQPPADLISIAPDGSGQTRLFATSRHESEGTFAPTGALFAFSREGRRTPPEIYVGDTSTGGVRRLTRHRAFTSAPTFTADGTRIVYFTDKDFPPPRRGPFPGCCPSELYVMNADGSGRRRLTRDRFDSLDPDPSPDGTRIVYAEARLVGRDRFENRIAVINADGSGRRGLTRFSNVADINPKWFPDGRRIVFERFRRSRRNSDIMVMNADGTGVRPLLATRAYETNPIPSPDGTKIVFTSDRDRRGRDRLNAGFEVYTMNVDGTGIARLTNNRRLDVFPDWQRLP